jgi:DNA-directed RNA polymerase subunit M/transcription elongation factor TFIIS
MPLFCPICSNLMIMATTSELFRYKCNKCETLETPGDKDSLVYEDVSGTNLVVYQAILLKAGRDPVNPKVHRTCKCGNKFAKQVRLGNEMKLINTCTKCGEQWLDGTRDTDNTESTEGAEGAGVEVSAEKSKPRRVITTIKAARAVKK